MFFFKVYFLETSCWISRESALSSQIMERYTFIAYETAVTVDAFSTAPIIKFAIYATILNSEIFFSRTDMYVSFNNERYIVLLHISATLSYIPL